MLTNNRKLEEKNFYMVWHSFDHIQDPLSQLFIFVIRLSIKVDIFMKWR